MSTEASLPPLTPSLSSPLSDICQLDGVDDLSLSLQSTPACPDIQQESQNLRIAPYNLNKTKQVSKLLQDTSIEDYEINVSPTGQNINIFCSTGFYSLVVLPAFSSLYVGHTTTASNIKILVHDITGKVDSSSSSVNTVTFFKLNSDNGKSNNVTITLHHTVRKVQVQGSSIISNNKRANIWFLENILLDMFRAASALKTIDISRFNSKVRETVSSQAQKVGAQQRCGVCDIPFSKRSQLDSCSNCGYQFHRKCLSDPSHHCATNQSSGHGISTVQVNAVSMCSDPSSDIPPPHPTSPTARPRPSTSLPPPPAQPNTPNQGHPPHQPADNNHHIVPPYQPTDNHPVVPHQQVGNALRSDLPHQLGRTQQFSPYSLQSSSSIAHHGVPPHHAVGVHDAAPPHQPASAMQDQNTTRAKRPNAKNQPAIDKISFQLECKTKQLVTAEAKIQELESENVKLGKTNHILSERIKMFENAQDKDLMERYFPSKSSQPHNVNPGHAVPCNTEHHTLSCCATQTYCCYRTPPCQVRHGHMNPTSNHSIDDLKIKVDEALAAIKNMKAELSVLANSYTTKVQHHHEAETEPEYTENPLSPVITVLEEQVVLNTPDNPAKDTNTHHDISASSSMTIDDHVEAADSLHLNSRVMTSQSPILMQKSPPS